MFLICNSGAIYADQYTDLSQTDCMMFSFAPAQPSISTHQRSINHQPLLFSVPAGKVRSALVLFILPQDFYCVMFFSFNLQLWVLFTDITCANWKNIYKLNQWETDPQQMRVSGLFPWVSIDGFCIFLFNTRGWIEIPLGAEKCHLLSNYSNSISINCHSHLFPETGGV